MSCYICNKETLETVLKAWLMCDSIRANDDESIAELWYDIVQANYEAVHDRYGDPIPDDLGERYPVPFTALEWDLSCDRPSKYKRYNALKEYMYQCAEGDYHKRAGYYKSQWCLDAMLKSYINE